MSEKLTTTKIDSHPRVFQGVGKEEKIYAHRFSDEENRTREITWKILCEKFFQPYVPVDGSVVDIAAGDGLFVRNIKANRRIAVDLNQHVRSLISYGIEPIVAPATDFVSKLSDKVNVVFMSNFLEHLPDKRVMLQVLEECRRALKPNGLILILQPNIRYVGAAYWDYIDHHIALTEHSLTEALEVTGYQIVCVIPRFLPYTARSKLGRMVNGAKFSFLIELYLKFPILWKIFGQQTFVVAKSLDKY